MAEPDAPFEMPTLADLVPVLIPVVGIAAIIVLTKTLIAIFPAEDVTLLFVASGVPVLGILYPFAIWWGKRHA